MRTILQALFVIGAMVAVVGYANSFAVNGGDSQGQAGIGTGSVMVEGCSADVEVDINGGDDRDAAKFNEAAGGFVIRSIDVDATKGDSDCREHTGKVWLQLMSDGDAYGPVLGPEKLRQGKASFDRLDSKKLLPGEVTDVHVMIELEE